MTSTSLLCMVVALEFYVGLGLILIARTAPELLGRNPWTWLYWFLPPLMLDKRCRPYVAGLLIFGLMYVRGRVIRLEWLAYLLVPVAVFFAIRWFRRHSARDAERPPAIGLLEPALVLLAFVALYIFSSPVFHNWFYYLGWRPVRGEPLLKSGMVRFVALTALLVPVMFMVRRRTIRWLLAGVLAFSMAASFWFLIKTTGGAPLYRDDHPSFIFRLWEFGKVYPQLENYSPYWNGGVVDAVQILTGVCAIGMPFWPLWHWLPVESIYTWVIGVTYIVIMPLMAVVSLRIAGGGWISALIAGVLAMGVSRHFFLWMLHFGTVGAALSASFVLPVAACLFRIVWLRRSSWAVYAMLVISAFFLVQWPPGALMGAMVVAGFLASFRKWTVRKLALLALCAVVVAAVELRSILIVMHQDNELAACMSGGNRAPVAFLGKALGGWKLLLDHIHEGHPLLIFLGLAGVFFVPHRSVRIWFVPVIIAFALVTGWGHQWQPGLQLGRMSIPMFFVAVLPASLIIEKILKRDDCRLAVPQAALLALLMLGGWNVARLYGNEGAAQYVIPGAQVEGVVKWIKENTAPDSRVLFAGSTVHGCGRGHVAVLPMFTGREMMACDYYHFEVGSVEYDYPPRFARDSDESIMRFMETYNVSAVMTFRTSWADYLRNRPAMYEEAAVIEHNPVFLVKRRPETSSLFLKGAGRVKADFNRFDVTVDDPAQDVVLKYNWHDGLRAVPPVELYPYDMCFGGITFIGVKPNGVKDFAITFKSGM